MTLRWLVACVGGAPSGPPAAGTGDTAAVTTNVQFRVWNDEGQCYTSEVIARPAEHWPIGWEFDVGDCLLVYHTYYETKTNYGTADGTCVQLPKPVDGGVNPSADWDEVCGVTDPWLLPCDAVPGCCDHDVNPTCP